MLRFLSLTGVLTVTFLGGAIALFSQTATGNPIFSTPSPEVSESNSDDTFFCYMRTGDGRVMDLTRICATTPTRGNTTQGQESNSSVTVSSSSQDVVNLEGGLGVNGCYIFDANGRPCSPVQ